MTNEQINIAIAEACGWQVSEQKFLVFVKPPVGYWQYKDKIPNYCNDLNAMHEAENKLTPFQRIKHGHFLLEILNETVVGYVSTYDSQLKSLSRVASATARQRAEAYLRTLEKWEEA